MNLNDITAFVAVADAGSINGAAARLRLTQPAVTRRVQALEEALGATLLDRQTKPPSLTPAGRTAYEQCRKVLAALDDLCAAVAADGEPFGLLRLGVTLGVGEVALTTPIDALRHRFPSLLLEVQTGWTPALLERVKAGGLEAAAVLLPPHLRPPAQLRAAVVAEPEIVVIASRGAALPSTVSLADLAQHAWVLNPEGCRYRSALKRALAERGAALNVAVEICGPELQFSLVAKGVGLGLVPRRLAQQSADRGDVRVVEVADFHLTVAVTVVRGGVLGRLNAAVDLFEEALARSLGERNMPYAHNQDQYFEFQS